MTAIQQVEKAVIDAALKLTNGNISRTANSLGLYRDVLRRKMRKYGLYEPPIRKVVAGAGT